MKASELKNERDRAYAEREERRRRAATYSDSHQAPFDVYEASERVKSCYIREDTEKPVRVRERKIKA